MSDSGSVMAGGASGTLAGASGSVMEGSTTTHNSPPRRVGRPPKERAFRDLDAPLRADILNAIDSSAAETAPSLYRRFGLEQRGIRLRHFKQVVHDRRAGIANRPTGLAAGDDVPEWDELDVKCRRLVNEKLESGDAKIYEIVGVLQATFKRREVAIKEEAEEREAEKYEQLLADKAERARAAIDAAAKPGQDPAAALSRLREDVRTIYGLPLAGGG